MYIKNFKIRNYMIHKDTPMTLTPLTVFVGPNGGGKSAFFDAMLNFSMLSRGSLRQAFGPYPYSFNATLWRGASGSSISRIRYEVSMSRSESESDSSYLEYVIDYAQSGMAEDQAEFTIFTERLTKQPGDILLFNRAEPDLYPLSQYLTLGNDRSLFAALRQSLLTGEKPEVDELVSYCTQQVSRFNKFRLDPNVLAQPSRLPEITDETISVAPRIGYRGEDLAATLYYLAETKSPILDIVHEKVREIDPEFSNFDFNTVGADRIALTAVYQDSRQTVPAVRLSSGTLIYIGLIVLVSASNRPPVLMIEEPENGLTPQAVKSFYKAVRNLAYNEDAAHRSQVLISSHSPFVICEAWNGEDRDFIHQVKIIDGKAQIRKFSEVISQHGSHLGRDKSGERNHLSLTNAEEMMSGYLS